MNSKKYLLLLIPIAALGLIIFRATNRHSKYASEKEAISACKAWQANGGKWKLKLEEFGISKQKKESQNPEQLVLENSNNSNEINTSHSGYKEGDSVKISLLLWGKDKENSDARPTIESTGYNMIEYERRNCNKRDSIENSIIGEEYNIKAGGEVTDLFMPSITAKKYFSF